MRLLIENDDGVCIEVKKIEAVSDTANLIIITTDVFLSNRKRESLEGEIKTKSGKEVVILDGLGAKIIGV